MLALTNVFLVFKIFYSLNKSIPEHAHCNCILNLDLEKKISISEINIIKIC